MDKKLRYCQCTFCGYYHYGGSKNCPGLKGSEKSKDNYMDFCRNVRKESAITALQLGIIKPEIPSDAP